MAKLKGFFEDLKPPPETVTVVTVLHYGANAQNGRYFASKDSINEAQNIIANTLSGIPFPIKLQSSDSADLDFCTLVCFGKLWGASSFFKPFANTKRNCH